MKRVLIASSIIVLALLPPLQAAESTTRFRIEEATIDGIQAAILKGELTSTQVVEMYLKRIKACGRPRYRLAGSPRARAEA